MEEKRKEYFFSSSFLSQNIVVRIFGRYSKY